MIIMGDGVSTCGRNTSVISFSMIMKIRLVYCVGVQDLSSFLMSRYTFVLGL